MRQAVAAAMSSAAASVESCVKPMAHVPRVSRRASRSFANGRDELPEPARLHSHECRLCQTRSQDFWFSRRSDRLDVAANAHRRLPLRAREVPKQEQRISRPVRRRWSSEISALRTSVLARSLAVRLLALGPTRARIPRKASLWRWRHEMPSLGEGGLQWVGLCAASDRSRLSGIWPGRTRRSGVAPMGSRA